MAAQGKYHGGARWRNVKSRLNPEICPLCGGENKKEEELVVLEDIAYWRGLPLDLMPKEVDVLRMLLDRIGSCIHRESMWVRMYGHMLEDSQPGPKVFDVFITRIRKELKRASVGFEVETLWGRGWRIVRKMPNDHNPS